ncbi:MAG TPA: class I SAM-dependent methyltransferase [Candidatus Gracilibacteria bacterium]|nr:class I SAM-dependent methyltransferase [Candidatus Gracilibacteria bacterium]
MIDPDLKIFLQNLKNYGLNNQIPNISETTAKLLHFLVLQQKAQNILEIGSANGYSTIWLADAARQNKGKVHTCDVSLPSFYAAQDNVNQVGLSEYVNFQFGSALQLFKNCPLRFDFVFLDAQKSEYHLFWELIKTLIHPQSLVLVDDVIKFPQKTAAFQAKIESEPDYFHCIIPVDGDDGIMLISHK